MVAERRARPATAAAAEAAPAVKAKAAPRKKASATTAKSKTGKASGAAGAAGAAGGGAVAAGSSTAAGETATAGDGYGGQEGWNDHLQLDGMQDGLIQDGDNGGGQGQLFCVCMGVDDGSPMIMCEGCENWFHFDCIGLSEQEASRIATYYCDVCQQAGSGKTEWSYDAPGTSHDLPSIPIELPTISPLPTFQSSIQASTSSFPPMPQPLPSASASTSTSALPLPPMPQPMTPSDSGEDDGDDENDGDYFASARGEGLPMESEGTSASTSKKATSRVPQDLVVGDTDGDTDETDDDVTMQSNAQASSSTSKRRKPSTSTTRRKSASGTSNAKRRKRVVEDEDEIEERKKKGASTSNFYTSTGKGKAPAADPADPMSNKTRKHCIESLEKILGDIYKAAHAAEGADESALLPISSAADQGRAVEAELFEQLGEIDPAQSATVRIPGKKYIAKFRAVHFNLKSNEYLRSRVASGACDPAGVVALRPEDTLTPEVRAEQEAAKERALAQSVKSAAVQPKTKMTHKGEEILENFEDAGTATASKTEISRGLDQLDTNSGNDLNASQPPTPAIDGFDAFRERDRSQSLAAGSPRVENAPRFGSPTAASPTSMQSPMSPQKRAFSPIVDSAAAAVSPSTPHLGGEDSVAELSQSVTRPPISHHSRSDSMSKSKLDLDAVWSTFKPTPAPSASPEKEAPAEEKKEKEDDDMDTDSDDESAQKAVAKKAEAESEKKKAEDKEEYDPFAPDRNKKSTADDDFDALMGGDEEKTAQPQNQKEADAAPSLPDGTVDPASLATVWEGEVVLPDEGSFSARLVQVGGTPFGPHPGVWDRILPKGKIEISGRIEEQSAHEYVVKSNFSPSRENIVLAILLNTRPSASPELAEKAQQMYNRFIALYSERKRYGVAPPSGELRKAARDHYIVPLRTHDPLPDYVELLDEHVLAEKGKRKQDYLLSVLVLQKGLGVNTVHRTKSDSSNSTPLGAQQASQERHPSQQQTSAPGNLPALDPAALQSLLSNPSLLQALAQPPAGQSPAGAAPGFAAGALSPPAPMLHPPGPGFNNAMIPGLGPQASPPWNGHQAPPPFPPQYVHQQPGPWPSHANPAGSPPWQGGPPQPPPGWQGQIPPPPPGMPGPGGAYIDPERIKAASAQAREFAERDRRERGYGGSERSNSNGSRHDRRDSGGPRNAGGYGDRRNGGGNSRRNEGNSNQMQAGIKDRGWGSRR